MAVTPSGYVTDGLIAELVEEHVIPALRAKGVAEDDEVLLLWIDTPHISTTTCS